MDPSVGKLFIINKIPQCYFHINFNYFRIIGTKITKIDAILYISFCYFHTNDVEIVKTSVEISFHKKLKKLLTI